MAPSILSPAHPSGRVSGRPSPVEAGRRGVAHRTLIGLFRRLLGGKWGIRAARIYAFMVSVSITATIWVLAKKYGPDDAALSLVARSAALLTWVAGGIATLALSAPAKDAAFAEGVAALALSRGHTGETIARAEMAATVRLLVEVIAVPLVAIGAFVFVFVAGGRATEAFWPIAGAIVFGLLASIVLGVVASGCRRWGGAQGRSWLLVIVLLPWLVAELVVGGRAAAYLSIPGLLGRMWETLTVVGS
jgi:hypothetical protein